MHLDAKHHHITADHSLVTHLQHRGLRPDEIRPLLIVINVPPDRICRTSTIKPSMLLIAASTIPARFTWDNNIIRHLSENGTTVVLSIIPSHPIPSHPIPPHSTPSTPPRPAARRPRVYGRHGSGSYLATGSVTVVTSRLPSPPPHTHTPCCRTHLPRWSGADGEGNTRAAASWAARSAPARSAPDRNCVRPVRSAPATPSSGEEADTTSYCRRPTDQVMFVTV